MRAFAVTYQNGHLIDRSTGKRIHLVHGAKYIVNGAESAFAIEDEKTLKSATPLSAEEKKLSLLKKWGEQDLLRIAQAETMLYFRVGLGRKMLRDFEKNYLFTCRLLEDQYLYRKKVPSGIIDDWRVAPCLCRLEDCISTKSLVLEGILGESLNDLFAKTVSHYFNGQRRTSTNVFDTFFLYLPGKIPVSAYPNKLMDEGVGSWRRGFVK